ncbi:MAG: SUF system Fe-S cluster assembly regulator [Gammaproteobacteria bacterium RIFCSPHIGHO2_12_FULL_41_15]|nr:MAG: SUF system Fe-S cluster assembly regulator [Gammaproteobacteria bacterium RIFCSPHIGHO2_12_FULL_41_15]
MLKISRLADYASVILDTLASVPSEQGLSATVIAERVRLALPTVSKILKQLHDAEIVKSERGTHGGYALNKPTHKITLAAIITAIDGRPALTECSHEESTCQQDRHCALRGNWQLINFLMNDLLANVSLAQMTQSLLVSSYARVSSKEKERTNA